MSLAAAVGMPPMADTASSRTIGLPFGSAMNLSSAAAEEGSPILPSARIVSISTDRSPLVSSVVSTGSALFSLSAPSPLTANARAYGLRIPRERQQPRHGAAVLDPLQRVRDRPPADARLPARVQHRRHQLITRLQPHERVYGEAEGRHRSVAARVDVVGGRLGEHARLQHVRRERGDRDGRGGIAEDTQGFGRASLDER